MKKIICSLAIAAVMVGCSKKETTRTAAPGQATPAPAATSTPGTTPEMPPGHPPVGQTAESTMGQNLAPANAQGKLTGTVAETMNSGGYTYIKVKTSAGEEWAAVQQTTVKKGQKISISPQMTAENFKSGTLNRTFDRVVFGTVDGAQTAAAPAGMGAMTASQHMTGGAAAIGDVKVPKADGANAKTIAEVWKLRPMLKDQAVTVRGKVVKFLPGIMGRNWMHLRDGSGTADAGDNDLTVTTSESAKVGDVVTVSGKVAVDKDFGAGYKYAVIVEEAKLTK